MALTIRATSDSMTSVLRSIRALDGISLLGAERGIKTGMKKMVKDAKAHVRVKTGNLRRSIHWTYKKSKVEGKVYGGDKHAYHGHLIEYGAKPVTIVPKRTEWLWFRGTHQYRGLKIRTKKANVPQRRAFPFLLPAVRENTDFLIDEMKKNIAKGIQYNKRGKII